jgi:hypothetical protein
MADSLKINPNKLGGVKGSRFSKTFKVSVLLGLVVVAIIGLNLYSSRGMRDMVEIVKLSAAVPQDGMVLQSNMYKDTMLRSEYEKHGVVTLSDGTKRRAIVLWEDRERITNAYAAHYIRQDTPLYWDSLTKEAPKQYAYLYQMDGELLKVDLDAGEFGKMLVPGDKINVRASYTEKVYTLPTEREFQIQQQMGIQPQTTVTRNILLFNNVTVLDILNSQGESIFDLYYRLLSLPKQRQNQIINSEEFQKQVIPKEILLNVTPEEADRYMSIKGNSPTLMMTLLPRTSGNLITEALNELQIGLSRDK